jgi:hypothetical protein
LAVTRLAGARLASASVGHHVAGKGASVCPRRKCLAQACRVLLKLGGRKGSGAEAAALALADMVRRSAQDALARRRQGLARRRLDAADDAKVRAWVAILRACDETEAERPRRWTEGATGGQQRGR